MVMKGYLIISNRGIFRFDYFYDAWEFCHESFFVKGDYLCIHEIT